MPFSMSLWWGLLRAHQRLALSGVAFSGAVSVAAPVLEPAASVPEPTAEQLF